MESGSIEGTNGHIGQMESDDDMSSDESYSSSIMADTETADDSSSVSLNTSHLDIERSTPPHHIHVHGQNMRPSGSPEVVTISSTDDEDGPSMPVMPYRSAMNSENRFNLPPLPPDENRGAAFFRVALQAVLQGTLPSMGYLDNDEVDLSSNNLPRISQRYTSRIVAPNVLRISGLRQDYYSDSTDTEIDEDSASNESIDERVCFDAFDVKRLKLDSAGRDENGGVGSHETVGMENVISQSVEHASEGISSGKVESFEDHTTRKSPETEHKYSLCKAEPNETVQIDDESFRVPVDPVVTGPDPDPEVPIELETIDGEKISAKYPNAGAIFELQNYRRAARFDGVRGTESDFMKRNSKATEFVNAQLKLASSYKVYRNSAVILAKWLPGKHKAAVTQRRGKALMTMGSTGDPTYLEFYEALYLLERSKAVVFHDDVPLTVFDAYSILLRDKQDHVKYLVYSHLVNMDYIVVPYLKRERVRMKVEEPSEEDKLLAEAAKAAMAPSVMNQVYERDSDSDLEVISVNMPKAPPPKEVLPLYEVGLPYEGIPIEFVRMNRLSPFVWVPAQPPELLPKTVEISNDRTLNLNKVYASTFMAAAPVEEFRMTRGRKRKAKVSPKKSKKQLAMMATALSMSNGLAMEPADSERYLRRWFPRWFDGLEMGVHSSSILSTLHLHTADGLPRLDKEYKSWSTYKEAIAKKITQETASKTTALYRGETKPMMTGTKGNMTSLIFDELRLGEEVTDFVTNIIYVDDDFTPRFHFDVYNHDSEFSKTDPPLPDFRVVVLFGGEKSSLRFKDIVALSKEADDITMLVAHVVDDNVRLRQMMPFSIPSYS